MLSSRALLRQGTRPGLLRGTPRSCLKGSKSSRSRTCRVAPKGSTASKRPPPWSLGGMREQVGSTSRRERADAPPPPLPAPPCDRERGRAAAARPQRSSDPGCAQPRPWPAHPPGSLQRPGRPSSFVPRASWRGEPGGEERKRVKGNRLSEIYPLLQFLEQI